MRVGYRTDVIATKGLITHLRYQIINSISDDAWEDAANQERPPRPVKFFGDGKNCGRASVDFIFLDVHDALECLWKTDIFRQGLGMLALEWGKKENALFVCFA